MARWFRERIAKETLLQKGNTFEWSAVVTRGECLACGGKFESRAANHETAGREIEVLFRNHDYAMPCLRSAS